LESDPEVLVDVLEDELESDDESFDELLDPDSEDVDPLVAEVALVVPLPRMSVL